MLVALLACTPDAPARRDEPEDTADAAADAAQRPPHALVSLFPFGESAGRLVILDGATGETVWEREPDPDTAVALQGLDAQLSPAGDGVLWMLHDTVHHDGAASQVVEVDRDGVVLRSIPTPDGHHSFTSFRDADSGEVLAYVKLRVDADAAGAWVTDVVVERAEDGSERVVFDPFARLLPVAPPPDSWATAFYGDLGLDWVHGNHLRWDAARGTYLFNMAVLGAAVRFTRDGTIVAAYLGADADAATFTGAPGYAEAPYPVYAGGVFALQHGPSLDAAGDLWVFDNGAGADPSAAARYRIEEHPPALVEEERIGLASEPALHALVLGGVDPVGDGEVWVNFGARSVLLAVDAAREVRWERDFGADVAVAHVTPSDATGFLE